jgi:hypothetical protein
MAEIPKQKIEMEVQIRFHDDSLLNATIFPLLSHQYDNPIDSLESFLNRRQREFFPTRLRDGSEALLPLSKCYVVELPHRSVKQMLEAYPMMSDVSLVQSKADVESFAIMAVTLVNKRLVKGTAWFHIHVPETERNVSDYVNRADRFLILHGTDTTYFVRVDAIQYVRAIDLNEALRGGTAVPEGLEDRRQSSLVDTQFRFASAEVLEPQYEEAVEEYYEYEDGSAADSAYDPFVALPEHLRSQEHYEAYQHAPLTPSRVVKKPTFDELQEDPELGIAVPPAGTAYPPRPEDYIDEELPPLPPERPGGATEEDIKWY